MDYVVTVDESDQATGIAEKLKAHQDGTLHRAFSVFIFNERQELLLQQRAYTKYHSGGLWTNTCCSHPLPGETTIAAAHRRLKEEMGFSCNLRYLKPFRYRAAMSNGLIENELDHLYTGVYNGPVKPDPGEVHTTQYLSLPAIKALVAAAPATFTEWFKLIIPDFYTGM